MFTIGALAKKTGLRPDTLRYYEKEGLLQPAEWSEGGYRLYDAEALRRIHFIQQAQECGFALKEIRELLLLSLPDIGTAGDIREKVLWKKADLEQRIRRMETMSRTLGRLLSLCCESRLPVDRCPILSAFQEMNTGGSDTQGSIEKKALREHWRTTLRRKTDPDPFPLVLKKLGTAKNRMDTPAKGALDSSVPGPSG